ncbi:FAD binding domain-containing protein [Desulfosporosinus sp. OT]|uniref:FAD binding domain-containing protein n=1 Tax=Desulfosporosinus sp. OT TaxID=913865 RepID=UPI000223A1D3|nr:FAD binding domain-containing protein [Desulfosporosinus sp. OT]EGW37195.1 FAD binding domain in molybdopterin dehydrogenase family protein [Desulfosporosinus sp. OT]
MRPKFKFACPRSITEVKETLSLIQEEAVFISGGTDLVIQLNSGELKPAWLIDLSQIPELNYIKEAEGRLRIGSATTFTQISESSLVREKARCLGQAAAQVGSTQIRNRATLGGNIAKASPAGDSLPALLALDAWVSILGPQGLRRVSFAQLQAGSGAGLQAKELITEIDFPLCKAQKEVQILSGFVKVGSRSAVTIARLNMALRVEIDSANKQIREVRWAVGALGRTPFRLEELELTLQGKIVNQDLAQEISERLSLAVDQAIPGRHSQEYKRVAIQGLGYDLLCDMFPEQMVISLGQ